MVQPGRTTVNLSVLAAISAGFGFLGLEWLAFAHAGVFEYPLDDVYIHLAMAEGIAHGTYGINPGEAASASASILYPLLLLPFPGTQMQRMLPLLWNVAAVLGLGWLWGCALLASGAGPRVGAALALLGPVLLNLPGVAFTGMENSLHALAALAVLLGLWRFLKDGRLAPWFAFAVIAAPMPRLEGLALSLLAAAAVALNGRVRAGLGLGLAAVAPVAAFMLFLTMIGLDPLPSSVLVKTTIGDRRFDPLLTLALNLRDYQGQLALAVAVGMPLLCMFTPSLRQRPAKVLIAVLSLSIAAHLCAGQFGWMFRYETYLIILMAAGLCLLAAPGGRGALGLSVLVMLISGVRTLPLVAINYVWAARAVHLQQAQMGRFADDFLQAPVAVNDIGRVAWSHEPYVLDLWGLGSAEARHIRVSGETDAPSGWAGALVAKHGIGYAMIYDKWLGTSVGADWRAVAHLTMDNPKGGFTAFDVTFYATDAAHEHRLRQAVRAFAPTLPQDAHLTEVPSAP